MFHLLQHCDCNFSLLRIKALKQIGNVKQMLTNYQTFFLFYRKQCLAVDWCFHLVWEKYWQLWKNLNSPLPGCFFKRCIFAFVKVALYLLVFQWLLASKLFTSSCKSYEEFFSLQNCCCSIVRLAFYIYKIDIFSVEKQAWWACLFYIMCHNFRKKCSFHT